MHPSTATHRTRAFRAHVLRGAKRSAVLVALSACPAAAQLRGDTPLPSAHASDDELEVSLFLVGDGGLSRAVVGVALVQEALKREIRGEPDPDRVRVLFLGDNIYPAGLPGPSEAERSAKERILAAQADIVGSTRVRGWFVPGNHDWGRGQRGVVRQGDFLRGEADGRVRLRPEGGCPGPETEDIGKRLRIIFLDTEWLLRRLGSADSASAACGGATPGRALRALEARLDESKAAGRHAVVAAHHPLASDGPHGGPPNNEQDLRHPRYRAMLARLNAAFAGRAPLVFAAGHDHALQVLRAAPVPFQLVSGSAAKRSELRGEAPREFGSSRRGFMRLRVWSGGAVRLDVYEVTGASGARRAACFWLERPPATADGCASLALAGEPLHVPAPPH
jgi:hypothetical protein